MQITKDELIEILEDRYLPYSSFVTPEQRVELKQQLTNKVMETIGDVVDMEDIPEELYDDITDDIQNCGRNPMSKFIDMLDYIAYVREVSPEYFEDIMDYLVRMINQHS